MCLHRFAAVKQTLNVNADPNLNATNNPNTDTNISSEPTLNLET